jgi:hypothetical protein
MRLRLVDLSLIGLAIVGLVPSVRAGELDQVSLRGSNAAYAAPDASPTYPTISSTPSYPRPAAASSYRAAAQFHVRIRLALLVQRRQAGEGFVR